jgi:DNA-binding transcriptional regulator YiaG
MPMAKKAQPEIPAGEAEEGRAQDYPPKGGRMSGDEFAHLRASLGKSQRELAELLGLSQKAVESYEQGWRRVPAHVERVLYFLLFKLNEDEIEAEDPCWQSQACPDEQRSKCIAYVAKAGSYCWFFTGKLCSSARGSDGGSPGLDDGGCYTCSVFTRMLGKIDGGRP